MLVTRKIGFTGTQQGMTAEQKEGLIGFLFGATAGLPNCELHHGDCIGADDQAHYIAVNIGLIPFIHPPDNNSKRAFKQSDHIAQPLPYLDRNHVIVDETDFLVATPSGFRELYRGSGTWATIRYAKRTQKPVYIIWPNGIVSPG